MSKVYECEKTFQNIWTFLSDVTGYLKPWSNTPLIKSKSESAITWNSWATASKISTSPRSGWRHFGWVRCASASNTWETRLSSCKLLLFSRIRSSLGSQNIHRLALAIKSFLPPLSADKLSKQISIEFTTFILQMKYKLISSVKRRRRRRWWWRIRTLERVIKNMFGFVQRLCTLPMFP